MSLRKRHRSAVSGQFVTERFARRNSSTTVSETVREGSGENRSFPAGRQSVATGERPALVIVVMADGSRIEI